SQSYAITADDDLPTVALSEKPSAPKSSISEPDQTNASATTGNDSEPLTVISNRANHLWQTAATNIRNRDDGKTASALVYYWDSFGNKTPPETPDNSSSAIYVTASRNVLNPLSDQREFGRMLRRNNCHHLAPQTYESIEEVQATNPTPQQLWFIKSRMRGAKENTLCVPTAVLLAASLPTNYVVQSGVSDIQLIHRRKFTFRCYVVVIGERVFTFNKGVVFVHASPYFAHEADFHSQVDNKSYRDTDSGIDVLPMDKTDHAQALLKGTRALASGLLPVLSDLSAECKADKFAVLGIDTLLKQEGSLALIRIHSFPNFMMTQEINDTVHVPLFESILSTMVGRSSELLTPVD
ncbi:MAG: tubulin--tyrosine ligase family protein, partial [Luminiphilus sp.]|nr:tubulin--tyrosine ligase family protein [Luminiphilus sp.]